MRTNAFGFAFVVAILWHLSTTPEGAAGDVVGVKGTVQLQGPAPILKDWPLDEAMQAATGEKTYREETWLVGTNQGLANCVVTLMAKKPADRVKPKALDKQILDKVGVKYVPHVLVVTPETKVVLRNQKSLCRGFRVIGNPLLNHNFNYNVVEGTEKEVTFEAKDICSVNCLVRPYTKGYIHVVDTPYFAVTDADGRFAIRGVPAGDYLVSVWHEAAGKLPEASGPSEIVVGAKGQTEVNFKTMAPKQSASK